MCVCVCVCMCVFNIDNLPLYFLKRKPKTALTLKKKRKRYRNKKKSQKQVTNSHAVSDSIFTPVENISVTTKNVLEHEVTGDVNEMQEASMVDGSTTSWFYLEPDNDTETEYQWDEEDIKVLKNQVESEERDKYLYDGYTDMDPCFPRESRSCDLALPPYIEPLDRISIRSKFLEMHSKMEGIKEIARNYRDRCKELKIEVIRTKAQKVQMEAEVLEQKQKTRYFWRNQILEGSSRSGRIVRNALILNCK